MAAKGIIGALLLAVPVMVAATIGVGGVGSGGLGSLAGGPSDDALGGNPAKEARSPALEQITTTLPELTIEADRRAQRPGLPGGLLPTTGSPGVTAPVDGGDSSSPSKPGGGSGGSDTPASDPSPAPPSGGGSSVSVPANDPIINQILQNLAQGSLGIGD